MIVINLSKKVKKGNFIQLPIAFQPFACAKVQMLMIIQECSDVPKITCNTLPILQAQLKI